MFFNVTLRFGHILPVIGKNGHGFMGYGIVKSCRSILKQHQQLFTLLKFILSISNHGWYFISFSKFLLLLLPPKTIYRPRIREDLTKTEFSSIGVFSLV